MNKPSRLNEFETATPKTADNIPARVLVTGGGKRVGRAICEGLAQIGSEIAIHYNSSGRDAEALAQTIINAGGHAITVQADLTDEKDARRLFDVARDGLGDIDCIVNNASIFKNDAPEDAFWPDWDKHFAVHLKAPAALASQMAMAAQYAGGKKDRLIVNIIDQRVWSLTPNFFSYTLSKAALWTATQTLAQALAPDIRVNAIGPGPTLPNERQDPADFQKQVDGILLKRTPALSEFAETILYLWRAKSVTGQMIALDGGQHLAWETPDVAGINE